MKCNTICITHRKYFLNSTAWLPQLTEEDDVDWDATPEEVGAYAEKLIDLRKQLDPSVKTNVTTAQERQKKHYDARHQAGSYKVGQLVLLQNKKKLSRKGDKMASNWTGPYEVAECVGDNCYRLRKSDGKKEELKSMFNSTRLKLFKERGNLNHKCSLYQ